MATGYCTNWGNDANDGLTWDTAKRTFQGAKDAGLSPVYAKGWFNEVLNYNTIIRGNNTILNYQNSNVVVNSIIKEINYFKIIKFNNFSASANYITNLYNSYVEGYNIGAVNGGLIETKLTIFNVKNIYIDYLKVENITIKSITLQFSPYDTAYYRNIIVTSNTIKMASLKEIDFKYSLFINTKFQFTGGLLGTDETTYTYPTGATDDDKLQNLRNRMAAVYGGVASDYLIGCKYYSRNAPDGQEEVEHYTSAYKDIFVDADNGDFHLVPYCIAAHMSYNGDYIGALPEGLSAKWSVDYVTSNNIDTNGNVIDQTVDGFARSNIIDIGHERTILDFKFLGEMAARNGVQINTVANLGPDIAAGTNVLTSGKVYMCKNDTITLDNAAFTNLIPFETFTAFDEGLGAGLGFTGNGVVVEVYSDGRYDEKIQIKTSKTDPSLATANTLTCYLNSSPVMVNIDSNGIPILGDADAGYDPLTAVGLRARFMQFIVNIKANQLPAR